MSGACRSQLASSSKPARCCQASEVARGELDLAYLLHPSARDRAALACRRRLS